MTQTSATFASIPWLSDPRLSVTSHYVAANGVERSDTKRITVLDAFHALKHACHYGPSKIVSADTRRVVYQKFPSRSRHLSFTVEEDGNRVRHRAETETYTIEGPASQIRPLVQYVGLAPCDGGPGQRGVRFETNIPHSYDERTYLPALLLHSLLWISDEERAILREYGITEKVIQYLRDQRGQGSYLNIITSVELWREGCDNLPNLLAGC